jgi:hypothetical protein
MATHNQEEGTRPRPLNKAAWLEALAALELEFLNFRNRCSPSPITGDRVPITLHHKADETS